MSFSNLFTKLSYVEEEPRQRDDINVGQGTSRKRKPQKQPGSYMKRQCLQSYATVIDAPPEEEPTFSEAHTRWPRKSTDLRPSVSSARSYDHKYRSFRSNNHNEGNTNNANNQRKKYEGRKGRETAQRYKNSDRNRRDKKTNVAQPKKRFMTQEFKDQNAVEVEGRLLCKYFLLGRCSKGEECQLEHTEGYNDLIKEICKFYVQGCCNKGATCPYMHESFPCKFFHKKGKCKSNSCRFSHDPLTECTQKLLDAAIQRENDLAELNRKAEEPVSQTVNEEQNTNEDTVIPAVRPSFYQSSEIPVEDKASLPHNELQSDIAKEDSAPQTENNSESEDSPASAALEQPGPVCYSVEAVLGPQLFKPVLYTATTTGRVLKLQNAPYSIRNVLRSQSGYTSHQSAPPVAQPAASCELKQSATRAMDDKYTIFHLDNIKYQNVQQNVFKQPSSFHVTATSGHYDVQCPIKNPSDSTMSSEANKTKMNYYRAKEGREHALR